MGCGQETFLVIFWIRMWLLFATCLKIMPEAKLETSGFMALAEDISKQPSVDFVV